MKVYAGHPGNLHDAAATQLLTGWGRTAPTAARVQRVTTCSDVLQAVAAPASRGVLARGLGRSYGDAAQNAGGLVLDLTGLNGVLDFDIVAGTVTVEAGVSLDQLLAVLVPQGWFVGVTPGTRYVTVGGAIASDVHGKNHHVDGGFCQWVLRFSLATSTGMIEVDPARDSDVFWATAGGMGLTGVVTQATLRLQPISSASMRVRTDRVPDLDGALALLAEDRHQYSVAWIDLLATGRRTGRAVVSRSDHADASDTPAGADPLAYAPMAKLSTPRWIPGGLLNTVTAKVFNEAWYRKAPNAHDGLQSLTACFHPLDGLRRWNRMYGPGGFVQYQFVVPTGREDVVRRAVQTLSKANIPTFLAVLKRLGPQPGLLSFPLAGWTLSLDVPSSTPGLAALLNQLDERVAGAGGRVYLTKDARLRPDRLAAMYPELDRWLEIQARLDPTGSMRSDLSRRLGLLPARKAPNGH